MKIIIHGDGEAGKDYLAEKLGMNAISSSRFAFEDFIWDTIKSEYNNDESLKEKAYDERRNPENRMKWRNWIAQYNEVDSSKLAKELFKKNDVYIGIRRAVELKAIIEEDLIDVFIHIDASERIKSDPSNDIIQKDIAEWFRNKGIAYICIKNNGTIEEFNETAIKLKETLKKLKIIQ